MARSAKRFTHSCMDSARDFSANDVPPNLPRTKTASGAKINARTSPAKFCTRLAPRALVLDMSREEIALSQAFDEFRTAMRGFIAAGTKRKRRAGSFAVEILGKRLLSLIVRPGWFF